MRVVLVCIAGLIAAAPLATQELGLYGASFVPRTDAAMALGAGMLLGGSFRLGSIMAESNAMSRSNVRVGGRIAFSDAYSNDVDFSRCIDDYPPGAHDIRVQLRVIHGSIFVFPYRSASTRMELGTGIAGYAYRGDVRGTSWGFTAGAAFARRLRATAPLWVQAGYERHGRSLKPTPADGTRHDPPRHSIRLGLTYRVSDRTKAPSG